MLNEQQLQILNQNFRNTNWSNARIDEGKLLATHTGEMHWTKDSGNIAVYNGVTECKISPMASLYTAARDYGFDQNGWVNENLDWYPSEGILNTNFF